MNEMKFTPTHEWLKADQDEAIVGITHHAQELLGDMVFVELPEVGDQVQAGDELGVVESVKAASDFYAPISGTVTAVNTAVLENPALVNSEPYASGWLVRLQPKDLGELDKLLDTEQYNAEIAEDH